MTTLTVNIDNEKDLPVLKEILNRFGLKYKVDKQDAPLSEDEKALYKRFKKTFKEIKDWEAGKKLQSAKEAIAEIEIELNSNV